MKDSLDSLVIYKVYVDMMYYFYMLTDKYPKHEKFSLVSDIKRTLGEGLSYIIYAQKSFDVKERLRFLNRLDASLKILKVFVRFLIGGSIFLVKTMVLLVERLLRLII